VRWPGRLEQIAWEPDIWVDGAHNVDSVKRMSDTLLPIAAGRPVTVVLGVGRDKDIDGITRALVALQPLVLATASSNPRAAPPERIAAAAEAAGLTARIVPSVAAALAVAREHAPTNALICVTGSLYAVAEAREALGLAETPVFERSLLYS
jgi:dihydrofolate synthase/folylpolyglutamate synthase